MQDDLEDPPTSVEPSTKPKKKKKKKKRSKTKRDPPVTSTRSAEEEDESAAGDTSGSVLALNEASSSILDEQIFRKTSKPTSENDASEQQQQQEEEDEDETPRDDPSGIGFASTSYCFTTNEEAKEEEKVEETSSAKNEKSTEEEKVEESFLEGFSTAMLEDRNNLRRATEAVEEDDEVADSILRDYSSVTSRENENVDANSKTTPVGDDDEPDPEEALKESTAASRQNNRFEGLWSKKNLLIGALALTVILLVAVLVFVLTKDSSSPSSSPATTPINDEAVAVCSDEDATCSFVAGVLLPVHPERTWSKLYKEGTCQNSALVWLAETDDILVIDPLLVQQRYALGTTYCELLSGENERDRVLQETDTQLANWIPNVLFGTSDEECFGDSNLGPTAFNPNCKFQSIELDGQRQPLIGTLAPELSIASQLESVSITNGAVKGEIPEEYGNLNLVSLDLSNNEISGEIPPSIVTSSIEELLLHGNQFTGLFVIYTRIAVNLRVVSVFNNSLCGDSNDLCSLVDNGNLTVFAADLNEIDCSCCVTVYQEILRLSLQQKVLLMVYKTGDLQQLHPHSRP